MVNYLTSIFNFSHLIRSYNRVIYFHYQLNPKPFLLINFRIQAKDKYPSIN